MVDVPLFVSRRRLAKRKRHPPATCRWALDSGGFSELSLYGKWLTPPEVYVAEVREWSAAIGGMDFAAAQDWMCEPFIVQQTGLSVAEHQRRTVDNYLLLLRLAPEVPWVPVLQGFEITEYVAHLRMYEAAGVDLRDLPRVGLGSVCRRQATGGVAGLVKDLWTDGFRLHGFGVKTQGLRVMAPHLASSDSLAWSFDARRGKPLDGCTHRNCANCLQYALKWREKVQGIIHENDIPLRPDQREDGPRGARVAGDGQTAPCG